MVRTSGTDSSEKRWSIGALQQCRDGFRFSGRGRRHQSSPPPPLTASSHVSADSGLFLSSSRPLSRFLSFSFATSQSIQQCTGGLAVPNLLSCMRRVHLAHLEAFIQRGGVQRADTAVGQKTVDVRRDSLFFVLVCAREALQKKQGTVTKSTPILLSRVPAPYLHFASIFASLRHARTRGRRGGERGVESAGVVARTFRTRKVVRNGSREGETPRPLLQPGLSVH